MLREVVILSVIFLFGCYIIQCDTKAEAEDVGDSTEGATDEIEEAYFRGRREVIVDNFSKTVKTDGAGERILSREKRGSRRRRRRRRRSTPRPPESIPERFRKRAKSSRKTTHNKLNGAYYIQHFKFFAYINAMDKSVKRVQADEPWITNWMYRFPTKPIVRLDIQLEEICEMSVEKCLSHVMNVSIHSYMWERFGGDLLEGKTTRDLSYPEEFATRNVKDPFGRYKEEYIYRATAMYYLCWWTMQRVSFLKHLAGKQNVYGKGGCQGFGPYDYRADDRIPWKCAEYSFCPDPCCAPNLDDKMEREAAESKDARRMHVSYCMWPRAENYCTVRGGNACYPYGKGKCRLVPEQNLNIRDLISNRINVTCDCESNLRGFYYFNRVRGCIDKNECLEDMRNRKKPGHVSICPEHTVCRNTQGSFVCECRKHYSILKANVTRFGRVKKKKKKNMAIRNRAQDRLRAILAKMRPITHYIRSCVKNVTDDTFKKIMDMLEVEEYKAELEVEKTEEKKKAKRLEGKGVKKAKKFGPAEKIEKGLKNVLRFITGKGSSAVTLHGSTSTGLRVLAAACATILLRLIR